MPKRTTVVPSRKDVRDERILKAERVCDLLRGGGIALDVDDHLVWHKLAVHGERRRQGTGAGLRRGCFLRRR